MNKHFTFADRVKIQYLIENRPRCSASFLAEELNISRAAIYYELKHNSSKLKSPHSSFYKQADLFVYSSLILKGQSIDVDLRTYDEENLLRCKVFHCDPYRSYQKAECERNHGLMRRIIKKGKSLDQISQEEVDMTMNHINSYPRGSLEYRTPYTLFSKSTLQLY